MRSTLIGALGRVGLFVPAYRAYERVQARRLSGPPGPTAPDGLPMPPAHLILQVAGTPDPDWFLEGGRLVAQSLRDALVRAGRPIESFGTIFDFGCGCGRVLRHWAGLDARIVGTDISAPAIRWCRRNLPFASFGTNRLSPPLSFEDGSFELGYALSVFTHLPEQLQHRWIEELARVVRPGGFLLVSTHGRHYLDVLDDAERRRFDAGGLVVRESEAAGTNMCAAFHPPQWVRAQLLPHGFDEVDFAPEGVVGAQDLYTLRRAG